MSEREWSEEWTVRHAQGIHPGPFTEKRAREWAADSIARDAHRRPEARGKTRLLRRYVTAWEEVE
jgi:hypothetical protein